MGRNGVNFRARRRHFKDLPPLPRLRFGDIAARAWRTFLSRTIESDGSKTKSTQRLQSRKTGEPESLTWSA